MNTARKQQIRARAKKLGNQRVSKYVEESLFSKMDQAGAMAGIWLDSLENHFDALEPEGPLQGFSESDFDALFQAIYGYER